VAGASVGHDGTEAFPAAVYASAIKRGKEGDKEAAKEQTRAALERKHQVQWTQLLLVHIARYISHFSCHFSLFNAAG
jgi:hypothetical protein